MSKTWTLRFSEHATKSLQKMDPPVAKDILKFLKERVITREDPRELGKPLVGPFKSFWRYRKGSYRIIVDIQDDCLVIEVINVDHRRDIYSSF